MARSPWSIFDARILQALKVELVDGVARVKDKLAQEDFLIGVGWS